MSEPEPKTRQTQERERRAPSFADAHREMGRQVNPINAAVDWVRGVVSQLRPEPMRFKMGARDDGPSMRALVAIAILASIAAVEFPFVIGHILTLGQPPRPAAVAKAEPTEPERRRPPKESEPEVVLPLKRGHN